MVLGLCIIGIEALRTIGAHGVGGDLLFAAAGGFFATFGMLVRLWRVPAMRAAAITSVLSLVGLPVLLFKFDNLLAAGLFENLLQAVIQGGLTGAGATYLFTRAVVLLGASRAVLFPVAGSAVHVVDRISCARRSAEHRAACRTGCRRRRLPADAEGLTRNLQSSWLMSADCREGAQSPESILTSRWLWIADFPLRWQSGMTSSRRLAACQKLADAVKRAQNIFRRVGVGHPHIAFAEHAEIRAADQRDA